MLFLVIRTGDSPVSGGTGAISPLLSRADSFNGHTLERPDQAHDPGFNPRWPKLHPHGHIPAGSSSAQRGSSDNDHNASIRLEDVPGFSGILVHPGSKVDNTLGCILPGYDWLNPKGQGTGQDELGKSGQANNDIRDAISETIAADKADGENTTIHTIVVDPISTEPSELPRSMPESGEVKDEHTPE